MMPDYGVSASVQGSVVWFRDCGIEEKSRASFALQGWMETRVSLFGGGQHMLDG